MKHKITFLFAVILICSSAFAGPVDLEEARGKAARFLKELNGSTIAATTQSEYASARLVKGKVSGSDAPAYYVFNAEDGNGFVIVSGEDNTDDILAYSDTGSFDLENMPDNAKAWLLDYAEQIAMMENYVEQKQQDAQQRSSQWRAVAPMLSTKWAQGAPYNDMCPMDGALRSQTGCGATAMAQIMKYYEWPQDSVADISGYVTETAKIAVPAFPATVFRWDEMKDNYEAGENADAVAELMRYCGQVLMSNYSSGVTTSYINNVFDAFQKTFGYSQNMELKSMYEHTLSEWEYTIYNELKEGRPVFHRGASMSEGGHYFVCDGYDGNGMFHINWGWGGNCDGYFKLALLNPDIYVTGSEPADGFREGQYIITGIHPSAGEEPKPKYFVPVEEWVEGTTLFSCFMNPNNEELSANVGFAIIDENNEIQKVLEDCGSQTLGKFYAEESDTICMDMGKHPLPKGIYRIATICRPNDSIAWKRVGSSQNYFIVDFDSNQNILSIKQSPYINWSVVDCKTLGSLVTGSRQNLQVTLDNKGDELNEMLYLFGRSENAMNSVRQSYTAILMKKGEISDYVLTFTPDTVGVYNLWLSRKSDGSDVFHSMQVKINEAPKKPSDLTLVSYDVDMEEFSVTVKIRNNSTEPYCRDIGAQLFRKGTNGEAIQVGRRTLYADIAPGETRTFKFLLNGRKSNTVYALAIYCYVKHTGDEYYVIGDVRFTTGETAVENIEATTDISTPTLIYRLDGTRVMETKQTGVYVVDGKKKVISN